jgi:hypothetical protein
MPDFTKLSALVDQDFTVTEAGGYTWKMWDVANSKMLTSDRYEKGYSKKYAITTDKGQLDLGPGQLASLLEAVYYQGKADINGKTFHVKSNGKTGMDIRYFFNPVKKQEEYDPYSDDNFDASQIPF